MTTLMLEADEALDLSDLDLLDDEHKHIKCRICQGSGPGVGFAMCGKRAYFEGKPMWLGEWPTNMCPECSRAFFKPCVRCGA